MCLACCIVEELGKLLWHVAPALVIVLGGSFIVQLFHVKRANLGAIVDSIIDDLGLLQTDALEYWNTPPKKRNEADLLAQKIKSSLRKISAKTYILINKYKLNPQVLSKSLIELHDKVTGGDFESQNRKPDATRYFEVTNAINSTMKDLLNAKV